MVAAGAVGSIVLGDKEQPDKTAMLNASHVVDLAELGADDSSGADVLYEAKVPSPLTASHCAGRGSDANGGNAASVARPMACLRSGATRSSPTACSSSGASSAAGVA